MKKFDIVKLKHNNQKYLDCNKDYFGIITNMLSDMCEVLFFNEKNWGDYIILKINISNLIFIKNLPEKYQRELENFITSNKFVNKEQFIQNKFNEYDLVEVTTEKEAYTKFGVHKGMKGVIMQNHAIKGGWYVIFTNEQTGEDIADVIINENDLKIME